MTLRRRALMAATLATTLPRPAHAAQPLPGAMTGANAALGHRLRDDTLPEPTTTERTDVVVVGGGIAGLSAAWQLARLGVTGVQVLELEPEPGGNSASGRNAVSAYPWGAHYVPLLTPEARDAAELFADLGIITGHDAAGRPVYDDLALCADPQERLHRWGEWQEDILPATGLTPGERAQQAAFLAAMEDYRAARGSDGRRAFAIPVDESSADPAFRALDTVPFSRFLDSRGWTAAPLRWYLRYCCRDDYGTEPEHTSAWAGIHYFASRPPGRGPGAGDSRAVLCWPGGNGHLVDALHARLPPTRCNTLAWRVAPDGPGVAVDAWNPATARTTRIHARAAILATPRFVADRLLRQPTDPARQYAPWVVANVTVSTLPGGRGWPLSWDNVIYGSESLGYVVATHQSLRRVQHGTVLTWYKPLSHLPPAEARRAMAARTLADWQGDVLDDLLPVHPELRGAVDRIDVRLWGHAMACPAPGALWGDARAAACRHAPPVFFAHSDMSGLSLFEEANHRGAAAARAVRRFLG